MQPNRYLIGAAVALVAFAVVLAGCTSAPTARPETTPATSSNPAPSSGASGPASSPASSSAAEDLPTFSITVTLTGSYSQTPGQNTIGYNPSVITVPAHHKVTLTFVNSDNNTAPKHDFRVDALGVQTKELLHGQSDTVTFVTGDALETTYYCHVGHHKDNGMKGRFVVQ